MLLLLLLTVAVVVDISVVLVAVAVVLLALVVVDEAVLLLLLLTVADVVVDISVVLVAVAVVLLALVVVDEAMLLLTEVAPWPAAVVVGITEAVEISSVVSSVSRKSPLPPSRSSVVVGVVVMVCVPRGVVSPITRHSNANRW